MKNEPTQNNNSIPAADPIAAWVGLDWADKKHSLFVRPTDGAATTACELEQKPQALDQFFLQLHQNHPQGRIAVCLEQSRGPVLYALMKYDFVVIYPVNPRCLADFRRAFKVSGAKADPTDADLLSELGCKHHQRLRALVPEDLATRQLRFLVEARRDFVNKRTALANELTATLKSYYPLALEVVGENLEGPMGLEFLRRWPNLAKLQGAKPSVVRAFFYAHNSRSEEKIAARLEAINTAVPLTEDPAIVGSLQLQAAGLARQLAVVQKTVAEYDQQIRVVFEGHSEKWLFEKLPGAGPVLAPRVAAAFGTIRTNLGAALDLLCLSGVAPVKRQSGQQETVHFRFARPKFLHQSLVEFAKCSIGQCDWARLLYEKQITQGKSAYAAIRVVAFKWVRILWRCWKDGQAYDEVKYLRSLKKRGIKLYESLYNALPAETGPVNNS
jgi:transposase